MSQRRFEVKETPPPVKPPHATKPRKRGRSLSARVGDFFAPKRRTEVTTPRHFLSTNPNSEASNVTTAPNTLSDHDSMRQPVSSLTDNVTTAPYTLSDYDSMRQPVSSLTDNVTTAPYTLSDYDSMRQPGSSLTDTLSVAEKSRVATTNYSKRLCLFPQIFI